MLEHLVEEHIKGGYYVSDKDPKFIEAYCEECGDSDTILTSWNPTKKNARLYALLRLFMESNLNTREDIYNKALLYSTESRWFGIDIITLLLNDIEWKNEEAYNIAFCLYEKHILSDEEYDKIMHILTFEEERQTKMIKYFEESIFTTDAKTGEKVLKLVEKK